LVMLPALVYFAAAGVRALQNARPRWPAATLVAVLALALLVPDDAMRDELHQRQRLGETGALVAALTRDPTPLAHRRQQVVETLAAAPWWSDGLRPAEVRQDRTTLDEDVASLLASRLSEVPGAFRASARFDLAASYLRAGQPAQAVPVLEELIAEGFLPYRPGREPQSPRVLLARALTARGPGGEAAAEDLLAAERQLEKALLELPGDPFALAELAALAGEGERFEAAVADLDRYVGEADRRWLLGQALRRQGRAEAAVAQLRPLARGLPTLRDVHLNLALALGAAGRDAEAVDSLLAANRLRDDPVLEVRATAAFVNRWADAAPVDAERQLLAARLLFQHGFFGDAARRLTAVLERTDLEPGARAAALEVARRLEALEPKP
ncbi:MAG: hypothetical protein AAF725_08265, partial [Acidobacteriota bacterium]